MPGVRTVPDHFIVRPPPQSRVRKRISAVLGRLGALLGTVLFVLGTIRAIGDNNWVAAVAIALGAALFLFGLIAGVDYFDDRVNRSPRGRCHCCGRPTVVLAEDEETITRLACPICEWQPLPLPAGDPRPNPIDYDQQRAQGNFARHYRYYQPAEASGWQGGAAGEAEVAGKRVLMGLFEKLNSQMDGREMERTWRAIQKAETKLEHATALRLGGRAALLARVEVAAKHLGRLP